MASVRHRRFVQYGEKWEIRVKLRSGKWHWHRTGLDVKRGADGEITEVNRRKAQRLAAELQAAEWRGEDPFRSEETVRGETFSAISEEYLKARKNDLGAGTFPIHVFALRLWKEIIGDGPVAGIGDATLERFARAAEKRTVLVGKDKSRRRVSGATVSIQVRNLRTFFHWIVEHELVANWKAPRAPRISQPAPSHRDYYTPEEAEKLVAAATAISNGRDNFGYYAAALLLTGLRKREAAGLEWEMINRQARIVLLSNTKSGNAETIPLTEEFEGLLDLLPTPHAGKLWRFSAWSGYVNDCWNRAILAAGIRRLKLHNCRDSFAVNMLLEGVPLAVVSRLLRHRAISTTMKNYAAFSSEDIAAILRRHEPLQRPGTYVAAVVRGFGIALERQEIR